VGLTRWLGRRAAEVDVPLLVVVGAGGRSVADEVALLPGVRVVDSPRAATVLLVVGRVTPALLGPLLQVHDQLPVPRATVWWPVDGDGGEALRAALANLVIARAGDGPGLRALFAELLRGARSSDPAALPDVDPAEWRGVGPYGQGGTGMTGGVPYGRPLAGRAPDSDGLELDQLPLHVGPLFPPFPPGLVLDIQLQGDVIREVAIGDNPYVVGGSNSPEALDTAVFVEALGAPQPVATLELARARHHLRWAAGALRLLGLEDDGARLLRLARSLAPEDRPEVDAVVRRLGRRRSLSWATRGVGIVAAEHAPPGPVARAAGVAADARVEDPAYRGLEVSAVVHEDGDAHARLYQRLSEATQALDIVERAGSRIRRPGPPLEGPRGPLVAGESRPSVALLELLPRLLVGQEWGDAMTAVASLDLDVEEAGVSRREATPA
jgi:hypothetical protein